MEVIGTSQSCEKIEAQALAVAVFKDEKPNTGLLKTVDNAVGGLITEVIKSEEFGGKEGESVYCHVTGKNLRGRRILLIGCGDRVSYQAAQITQMAGSAARFLRSKNAKSIAIIPRAKADAERTAQAAISGAIMGLFEPDKYRTKDKEKRQLEKIAVVIEGAEVKALQRGAERGRIIGEAAKLPRHLA